MFLWKVLHSSEFEYGKSTWFGKCAILTSVWTKFLNFYCWLWSFIIKYTVHFFLFTKKTMFYLSTDKMCLSPALPAVSQGSDTDITGAGEKAESSRYSRSYTSGATLGAELRRGRSRRLSSSLQVLKGSMGALTCSGHWGKNESCASINHPPSYEHNIKGPYPWLISILQFLMYLFYHCRDPLASINFGTMWRLAWFV